MGRRFRDWLIVAILRLVIFLGKLLPWGLRIRLGGWFIGRIAYMTSSARKRIAKSTGEIFPDWSDEERQNFTRLNLRHFGQNMIELYNIKRFSRELPYFKIMGEGWEVLRAQRQNGQGAIIASGHIGHWEAIRAYLNAQGAPLAAVYKETSNPHYEKMFRNALEFNGPVFHTGVRGMASFVKILRKGGFVSLLHDQRIEGAPLIPFMGKPANTSTAAAEMALKYDVPLIPVYAIRQKDGRHYHLIAEAAIEPSSALDMTRALNDSLSAMVNNHTEQWLWLHDRWHLFKPSARASQKAEK